MKYKIIVDKQSRTNPSNEKKTYEIDIEELRFKGDVHDSLIITKDEDYVIRRLSLSKYKVLSVLIEPIKEPLQDINIELFEGDNYVYLEDMVGNQLCAEYIVKNEFNDIYVTRNEMNSAINQTEKEIDLSVNQKLTGYSTTQEMNSAINLTASNIISAIDSTFEDYSTTTQINNIINQKISDKENSILLQVSNTYTTKDSMQNVVRENNIVAKINLAVTNKQGVINIESNQFTLKSDKTTLDANGKLTTSEIIATGGQIAGLKMSHEQNGSYLAKTYTTNNTQYQSGFYIPDSGSGSSIFLYAGCPTAGYLADSNLYIRHDGLIKAKWFEVNGESGYFYVNYNSNRRAMTLSKTGIDFFIDNSTNNNFASMTYGSQYWNFILYDTPHLSITDGVHDRMALTYEKYNPSSSNNLSKVGDVFWFNSVLYVQGNRYNNLNNTIYIQGYEVATNASDERLKENKVECKENSLEVTDKIPIISFDWKKDIHTRDAGKHIRFGYGAQRTKKVFEDGVNYSIENDTYQMNLLNLSALHHKNIQDIHSWMQKIEEILKLEEI